MGQCIIMVNLLWAVHLTLMLKDARYVPPAWASDWACIGSCFRGLLTIQWASSTRGCAPFW